MHLTKTELLVLSAYLEYGRTDKVSTHISKGIRVLNWHCARINAKFGTDRISKSCLKAVKTGILPIPESVLTIDVSKLSEMDLRRCYLLVQHDLDFDKVCEIEGIAKRSLDGHLLLLRKKVGAMDSTDLLLMVAKSS